MAQNIPRVLIILNSVTRAAQPVRQYTGWAQRTTRLCTLIADHLMKVGQMQILRLHAASRLNSSCKFDAKYLAAALSTMNE